MVGSRRARQQAVLEQQRKEQERLERVEEREPSYKPAKSVKSTTEVNGQAQPSKAGTNYAKSQSAGESSAFVLRVPIPTIVQPDRRARCLREAKPPRCRENPALPRRRVGRRHGRRRPRCPPRARGTR